MNNNSNSNKSVKYKFVIPSKKLPSSLAEKVRSPLWKNIIHSIETGKVEPVLELVKSIDKRNEPVCLPHPFIENLNTFASKSMRQGMCNFIFFNDSNNLNQWILCQCTSFVDAIFTESYSGKHKSSANDDAILNAIRKLFNGKNKISAKKYGSKKAVLSGYLLDQKRPYHHFYDQLKWLVSLETEKPIIGNNSFFVPKACKKLSSERKNKSILCFFLTERRPRRRRQHKQTVATKRHNVYATVPRASCWIEWTPSFAATAWMGWKMQASSDWRWFTRPPPFRRWSNGGCATTATAYGDRRAAAPAAQRWQTWPALPAPARTGERQHRDHMPARLGAASAGQGGLRRRPG